MYFMHGSFILISVMTHQGYIVRAGCCLMAAREERSVKHSTQAWSAELTTVQSATLEIGREEGSGHKLIMCSKRLTGHGRGQMCVTNSKGICF
ncbi:unnamed protein product [Tetraodon nigroviridis]|uniref:(spotted green pufferfish) hypothetical protein n=1 Tax=Tetraodon nigroviridis TaxID=99883 RepID=Q4SK72_TETNG|nr:unnamed protein product [Tetraodon nigroviridis]